MQPIVLFRRTNNGNVKKVPKVREHSGGPCQREVGHLKTDF